MYKIYVQSLSPKLTPSEYSKYLSWVSLLKEYNKCKESTDGISSVNFASRELREHIKNFRAKLKVCRTKFIVNYEIKNRTWKKIIEKNIGKLNYSFEVQELNDKSIFNNKKHLKYNKQYLEPVSKMNQMKIFKTEIRRKYQEARQSARQMRLIRRNRTSRALNISFNYELCGFVMHQRIRPVLTRGQSPKGYKNTEMGAFMKFLKSKDKQIVFEEKKPQTKDNYLGVEIEFFCDLNQDDLSFKLYEQGLGKYICLKFDGSIRTENNMYPHEVTILAKEKEMAEVIQQVSKILLASNAKVNKSCGLHVHLDMRNRDHEVAFHNLVSAQNILFAMNPYSRQSGTYCKRVDSKDFKSAASGDRYFGINATAHKKHHTIEIRLHSGTVQAVKINNWIELLLLVIAKKEAVKKSASSLKGFIKQYDIDSKLANYIAERMALFVGEDNKDIEEKGAA